MENDDEIITLALELDIDILETIVGYKENIWGILVEKLRSDTQSNSGSE